MHPSPLSRVKHLMVPLFYPGTDCYAKITDLFSMVYRIANSLFSHLKRIWSAQARSSLRHSLKSKNVHYLQQPGFKAMNQELTAHLTHNFCMHPPIRARSVYGTKMNHLASQSRD